MRIPAEVFPEMFTHWHGHVHLFRFGPLLLAYHKQHPDKGFKMRHAFALVTGLAFLLTILAANFVTTEYGMVPVGFGLTATAGTFLAGLMFVLRDSLQDLAGKRVTIALITAGATLSFLVSDPFIALASGVAFGISELADLAVYSPLRKKGYVRAALASNVTGSLIDTVLFLWIAGFPILAAIPGQLAGKFAVTALVVGLVAATRCRRTVAA